MSLSIPIILAIAGGFGVIAYRTPHIYKKLSWILFIVCPLTSLLIFIYSMAWMLLRSKLEHFIAPDKSDQAKIFFDSLTIDSIYYLYPLLAMLYFGFLDWLSYEVINHKKPKKKM